MTTLCSSFALGQRIITADAFRTADFINGTGWIAGNGILLKTEDGGQSWSELPMNMDIYAIDFINDREGWAIGVKYRSANILNTQDGGLSWEIQKDFGGSTDNIHVINDTTVYVGSDRELLKTLDGGLNWTIVPLDLELSSIWFFSTTIGIITAHTDNREVAILRSLDGGNTWLKEIIQFVPYSWKNLQFINDSTGYFIAKARSDDPNPALYTTSDTLNSWTMRKHGVQTYYGLDNNTVYAIIDTSITSSEDNISKSTDGGLSWNMQDSGYDDLILVKFVDYSTGWVVGSNGTVLVTTDGGDNWIDRSVANEAGMLINVTILPLGGGRTGQ
jgi:photosystem II stability/assembly factor-like uncharacterized protein